MAALSQDTLSRKDLAEMRGEGSSLFLKVLLLMAGLIAFFLVLSAFQPHGAESFQEARDDLASLGMPWAQTFVERQEQMDGWLQRHGLGLEINLFRGISETLFRHTASIGRVRTEQLSFFNKAYLSFNIGLLRILFVIIACWRLWAVSLIAATLYAIYSTKVYHGRDILGLMGNGRLFYSGIRADLDEVNERGVPEKQVVGLACPARETESTAKSSALARTLHKFGAFNETNLVLVSIILKHPHVPAYVAVREEAPLLEKAFAGSSLPDQALLNLEKVLSVHAECVQEQHGGKMPAPVGKIAEGDGEIDAARHAELLELALRRVVTPEMRAELARIEACDVATAALALDAGKVMALAEETEGRWVRRSSFPQLSARAVLHSIPEYGEEYNATRRSIIRRAVIYSSRSSVFAPVRFPIDLSAEARALRQWTEVLSACPHELQSVADEVELHGLIVESHDAWHTAFVDTAMTMGPAAEESFATLGNMLFVPLQRILDVLRKAVEPARIKRLDELILLVGQKQKLERLSDDMDSGEEGESTTLARDRLPAPIAFQDVKKLTELHGVSAADLKEWSSLRSVLNAYGWLGKRVGDYTVPDSSVIFAVFAVDGPSRDANDLGLVGKTAMVPLRATRLAEKWGKSWQARFRTCRSATMAETREDFDKLMRGQLTEAEAAAQAAAVS